MHGLCANPLFMHVEAGPEPVLGDYGKRLGDLSRGVGA